jgi:DNA polymerase-3 subunit epsilon
MLGYAVVDLETSGFHPPAAEIVEVAIVHVDAAGAVTGSWDSLLRPPSGSVGATWVHGITPGMVRRAPTFASVAPVLHDLLADRIVVAHNLAFDGKFLVSEFAAAGLALPEISSGLCTLRLAQRHLAGPSHRLADCCRDTGIVLSDAHSAVGDATATAELLGYFLRRGVVGGATTARPVLPGQRSASTTAAFLSRRG